MYYFDGNLIVRVTWLMILVLTSTYYYILVNLHIDRIAAKAYSRIDLLFRGFVSRNLHACVQANVYYLYQTLLEYASNV